MKLFRSWFLAQIPAHALVFIGVQPINLNQVKVPGEDLEKIEAELRLSVETSDPVLSEVATHLIEAGGKRIRPILALAAARAVGEDSTIEVVRGASAVELVHLASLYHDDVMDEANERRGVVSVNARWGNLIAVVSGDFLLARAAGIAARLGSEIAELLADTLAEMCEGQIAEVKDGFNTSRSKEEYLRAISGKTASLMATSARIGALAAKGERGRVQALTEIGNNFGMLFQIRDDVLDIAASREELRKLPGQDLLEGVYNLPVIMALESKEVGGELRAILDEKVTEESLPLATKLIIKSKSIDGCYHIAEDYYLKTREIAVDLADPYSMSIADLCKELLGSIAEFTSAESSDRD